MTARRWSTAVWQGWWVWLCGVGALLVLAPLLADDAFVRAGAAGAAVVVAVGVVLRGAGVAGGAVVLAELVAAVGWMTAFLSPGTGLLGVVPTPATLGEVGAILVGASRHAQEYAPPVPPDSDLDALLVAVVLLLVVVTDAVAVWLGRAPLLGLVWLALYVTPATLVGDGLGMRGFVVSAVAFGGLLVATGPGHRPAYTRQTADEPPPSTPAPAQAGALAVTVVAVVCAVALAPLLPAATANLLAGGGGSGTGSGSGLSNPVLDMRRNLQERSSTRMVRVSALDSAPSPRYLRLASLAELDDGGWSVGSRQGTTQPLSDGIPGAPGLVEEVDRERARYTATVDPSFRTRWLPHLYPPVAVDHEDADEVEVHRTALDMNKDPDSGTFAGDEYTFTSDLISPSAAQLRLAPKSAITMSRYTQLPDDTPAIVAERAFDVVGSREDPFDQALALQTWLRSDGGFVYDLDRAPGSGMETIEAFLTDDRRGYCEQFAAAMAMMARSLDIPARVAVGFLSGEPVDGERSWIFRGIDMHAWPELYFAGIGWVGFEPTPGGSGYSPPSFVGGDVAGEDDEGGAAAPNGATTPEPTTAPGQVDDAGATPNGEGAKDGGGIRTALVVVALMLVLAAPGAWRVHRRRRRRAVRDPSGACEAAWSEVGDTAVDLGLDRADGLSPRAAAAPLRARLASSATAGGDLDHLVDAIERARYSAEAVAAPQWSQVENLRAALASSVSRRQRLLATVAPRSVLRPRGSGAGSSADETEDVLSLQE